MVEKWFGVTTVNAHTNFDQHLWLFIFPFAILAFLVISAQRIKALRNGAKQIIAKSFAFTFIALATIQYLNWIHVQNTHGHGGDFLAPLSLFNNMDMTAGIALSAAVLANRFGLARALVPAIIVFSSARIINNPGVVIENIDLIRNVFLLVFAITLLFLSNRTITVQSFLLLQMLSMAIVVYVFAFNAIAKTTYSTFSLSVIANNPVYSWMAGDAPKIAFFFALSALFELAIWLVIRLAHHKFSDRCSYRLFFASLQAEVRRTNNQARLGLKTVITVELLAIETLQEAAVATTLILDNTNEESKVTCEEKPVYHSEVPLLPIAVIRTKNAHGTRAPAF